MASPAIGHCPCPPLLDPEQQLFLQSLSAHERKKMLKQRRRQAPAAMPWPRGAAGGGRSPPDPGEEPPAASTRHEAAFSAEPEPEPARGSPPAPPVSPGAGSPPAKPPRSGLLHLRLRLRAGAPRLLPDVRTIFEQPRDPRLRPERGAGHRFRAFALCRGWCDLCGQAVQQRALRCANCRYTCHQECRALIQLDCSQQGQPWNKPSPENTLTQNGSQLVRYQGPDLNFIEVCGKTPSRFNGLWIRSERLSSISFYGNTHMNVTTPAEEEKPKAPTVQEIKQKIDIYNTKVTNCFLMKLNEDGTYTGFIKVHLKLRRPVTVPAGIRPQSIYDALKEVNLADMTDKRTSFYLPLDAVKQLHISSTTTVSEVIQGLLKKFMVVDNPQKFALFKEIQKDGQVLFQKLSLTEYPLYLRLLAGPDTDILSFVLKENETGEVEWDAFSIPELQNFLVILDREEKDKIQQVQKKYSKFKQRLQETLKEAGGKPG